MNFRNIKNVPYYVFGKGAIRALGDLLKNVPHSENGRVVFCIDAFFKGRDLINLIPTGKKDIIFYIDTKDEPKNTDIDYLRDQVGSELPYCVVGIGGGITMDVAKALSNLLTNGGQAAQYQGWDLVKGQGIYKIGIPTLSGTGSESSRTCVLTDEARGIKLGMNSDFTMFDQLIMDPDLSVTVSRDQYFYTGMDTYFHCVESLRGSYRNVVVDALSEKAVEMCRQIFLSADMMSDENREKMMIASYLGGCAAGNVGVIHPVSAGLSIALKMHHGIANCYAMNVLEEFYPAEYAEYQTMMTKQKVKLPKGIGANLSNEKYQQLLNSSVIHEKPLTNALGKDFRKILTDEKMISLFKRM
ncbi:MAG: iron-containing alcohol dehydrogenase [Candidatus Omnitrophica bacterium]|nr:iron-containing alcohol dehydrogenase [Candidatus Omnitrophota bacterium]